MNINPKIKRFLLWRQSTYSAWIEPTIITIFLLFLCHIFNPTNPLFVKAVFPWPWIAPIITVLAYGFAPGLFSVFLIALSIIIEEPAGSLATEDFQTYFLSGLAWTLLCALFSSNWLRRVTNAEELRLYTEERLNDISSSYYMLRVSHDSLEQSLITKPTTLRSVMENLKKILIHNEGKLTQDICYRFLQLVCQNCYVTSTGIFLFGNKKINPIPFAKIGPLENLIIDDPLVRNALESDEIGYISINSIQDMTSCNYLAIAPMQTHDGVLHAILVIKEMSFWTLTDETLKILSILVSYFMEEFQQIEETQGFLQKFPSCPIQFAKELQKLLILKLNLNVDSALVAIVINKQFRPHSVIGNLQKQQRTLDCLWNFEMGNFDVLVTLMPFTEEMGVQGYISRVSIFLKKSLGLNLSDTDFYTRAIQLYPANPIDLMNYFINWIRNSEIV